MTAVKWVCQSLDRWVRAVTFPSHRATFLTLSREERDNTCMLLIAFPFKLYTSLSVIHVPVKQDSFLQQNTANYRGGEIREGRKKNRKEKHMYKNLIWNPTGCTPAIKHLDLNKTVGKARITRPALYAICYSAAAPLASSFLSSPILLAPRRIKVKQKKNNNLGASKINKNATVKRRMSLVNPVQKHILIG